MKLYRLLKYIEPKENSINIGESFEIGDDDIVNLDNGLEIPANILERQGFIEYIGYIIPKSDFKQI